MNRFAYGCLSLFIVLCGLFATQSAEARCTATVTALNFGSINPVTAGAVDVNATVDYSCSSVISLLSYIKVCIEIGPGASDTDVNNRYLPHATVTSDRLAYNVYSSPARNTVIGNVYGSASPPVILQHGPYAVTLLATAKGTQTVYGRIAASNPFMQRSVGPYNTSLTVTVRMSVISLLDLLPCVDSNPAVVPMPVMAQMLSACQITAGPLDFGRQPSNFSSAVQSTSQINSSCTKGTAYQIGLNNGLYASGNQRRMRSANGQYINYELYKNAGRTQRWGMALNTPETVTGQATGSSQNTTVYGQVIPQSGLRAADYKDTVTVTITY